MITWEYGASHMPSTSPTRWEAGSPAWHERQQGRLVVLFHGDLRFEAHPVSSHGSNGKRLAVTPVGDLTEYLKSL
jgi:hypothetical protein